MNIVICICTRNRPDSLVRTLSSIASCARANHDIRILITINEDPVVTGNVLENLSFPLPLHTLVEPRAGITHARNRALQHLVEHYPADTLALWTDDDVIVDRNWIVAMAESAQRFGDGCIYGGRVIPALPEGVKDAWAGKLVRSRYRGPLFAYYQPASRTGVVEQIPVGPNFAFFLSCVGGHRFPQAVGLGHNTLGEETAFLRSLVEDGLRVIYCHAARVNHMLRGEQLTAQWALRRMSKWGRGAALAKSKRWPQEKIEKARRNTLRRMRIHGLAVRLFFFSKTLSLHHRLRISYYRSFLETLGSDNA